MYKYFSILTIATFFSISNVKAEIKRDSIGIENLNGKKVIIHKIVAHDTYYSLSRRYNVSPKEIMSFNDNKYLQIGVIVKVPTLLNFYDTRGSNPAAVASGSSPLPADGSEEIEYVVVAKDNLNRIAEKHGTTVNEIKRLNKLSSINLHIGQVLKIPATAQTSPAEQNQEPVKSNVDTNKAAAAQPVITQIPKPVPGNSTKPSPAPANPAASTPEDEPLVEHTVASNETIYSIATTYHLTMDQLKAKNNLKNNSLHVGQKLLISGQYGRIPKPSASEPLSSGDTTLKDPSLRGAASRYGLNQVDEKGTAIWITDPDLDPVKMLVLHRTAPVGTIIKVTNPMTNRSTFAKVVGKFTENESTRDVIIVMTKAVAESIGALDKRFFCNLTYSGQEIEQ